MVANPQLTKEEMMTRLAKLSYAFCVMVLSTGCIVTQQQKKIVPREPLVLAQTVDKNGDPLKAKRVFYWYPHSLGEKVQETDAICHNNSCTLWTWVKQPYGDIYVAATYFAPDPAEPDVCFYDDYVVKHITIEPSQKLKIIFVLKTDLLSCY